MLSQYDGYIIRTQVRGLERGEYFPGGGVVQLVSEEETTGWTVITAHAPEEWETNPDACLAQHVRGHRRPDAR